MLIKTDPQNYTDIANALRSLTNSTDKYKPEDMLRVLKFYGSLDDGLSYDSLDAEGNVISASIYGNKLFGFAGNEKLESINFVSDDITSINDYAFHSCKNLVLDELPKNLTYLGGYAFTFCENVTFTSLPENIKRLGGFTFKGCKNINIKSIPASIEYINAHDFGDCPKLTTITFEGTPKEGVNINAFYGCTNITTINVPWSEGEVTNVPWGATNATINYNHVAN